MNRKHLIGLTSALLIPTAFLVGCQSDTPSGQVKVKEEAKVSLVEQGYSIQSVKSYGDGANVVHLKKESKTYVGTVNDDFEWLMEPTDQYQDLVFHEGLAAVSVPEERAMILANDSKAKLWGFINPEGEYVIEPIYRNVKPFSDGVAIVETIEEDRDDLMNSRLIVIDKAGKEVGEMVGTHLHTEKLDKNKEADTYAGGYAYAKSGFYDRKGNFTPMDLKTSNYIVVNEKRFESDGKNRLEVTSKSLNGDVLNTFSSNNEIIDIVDIDEINKGSLKPMTQNNVVLINGDEKQYLVDASSMSVLLRGKMETNLGEGLLFVKDLTNMDTAQTGTHTGTFFDYNGKKITTVNNMVGPLLLQNRYFVQGNEYYKLVDTDGNVLIDEDKKITEVEVASYNDKTENPFKTVVQIKYREDANDVDPNEALLNVETLKIIEPNELLEYKQSVS